MTLPSSAEAELLELINKIQKLIDEARLTSSNTAEIASLPLPLGLNDELNGFFRRYSIPASTVNAMVQPLLSDSELQLTQVLNGAIQLAKARPHLSQLITSLFSSLDTYLAEGETRLAAARHTVEQWFDEAMERTSGWYKRSTQLWLGVVGLFLACILNVDTLSLATALWRDPTLRSNVVEQAQKYQPASDEPSFSSPAQVAQAIRELNAALSQDLQLPIGWKTEFYELRSGESCVLLPQRSGDVWGISTKNGCMQLKEALPNQSAGPLAKLLGLLLTAIAVSQGAPFWFDLLSRVTNQRGAGPVPATSEEKRREKLEIKAEVK